MPPVGDGIAPSPAPYPAFRLVDRQYDSPLIGAPVTVPTADVGRSCRYTLDV